MTILITGASSGIGFEIAKICLKKGYSVIGLSVTKNEELKCPQYICDLSNFAATREVVNNILKDFSDIDVLINNAGKGISGTVEQTPVENVEDLFKLNYLAQVNMTQILTPTLKRTKGKVMFTGSVAGIIPIPFQSAYSSAKAAIENFSAAYGMEVKPFKVQSCVIRPGDTKTNFTAKRVHHESEGSDKYDKNVLASIKKMEKAELKGMSPVKVAKKYVRTMEKKHMPSVVTIGFSYKLVSFLHRILPKRFLYFLIRKIYASI